MRRLPPRLLALTPGDLDPARARDLPARVRAAAGAGLRGVLLREPDLSDRAWLALALELRQALDEGARGGEATWLGVHDRAHLARECRADGVHVGWRSLSPAELRGWLEGSMAIGLSTHAGDPPGAAQAADYVVHGPVRAVPGKGAPVGLDGLRRAVDELDRPLWALGGLDPTDVGGVLASGARGVAVLRGLLAREDPAAATAAWLRELARAAS